MSDNQVLYAYYAQINEQLRFLKKQQWSAVNYTVLLHIAIISAITKFVTNPTPEMILFSQVLIVTITILALGFTINTLCTMKETREREQRIFTRLVDSQDDFNEIMYGDNKDRKNYFIHDFSIINGWSDFWIILPIKIIILISTVLSLIIIHS